MARGAGKIFDPFDRFAQYQKSQGKSLADLLDVFAQVREHNLKQLRAWELDEAELARRGRHPDFGIVTLGQLLATWVVHDLDHLAQIARVQAKQYAREVGPWQQYLPILRK